MQESEAQLSIDTTEGTLDDTTVTAPTRTPSTKLDILSALAAAVSSGNMTAQQARSLRSSFGISQARFTRKQVSKKTRKNRRKMQAASRRANWGNGKGQQKSGRV